MPTPETTEDVVSVRYMVDDVEAALGFYTTHFGFEPGIVNVPAFAEVTRGNLRLLLSGPKSSAGRAMPDGVVPEPGGWNRIHFVVDDIEAEIARLRDAGVTFRNEIVTGPGGTGASASDFVVKHARNVSLNLTNKAKGKVTVLDGFSSCASGVPVKLQMKGQGGGFKNVNSGTTKPNGSYNLGSVTAGERYRVIAKTFTTPSGDKCLKDASPTVRA